MERQEYNNKILSILSFMVNNYPDLRFGQILVNIGVIKYDQDILVDGQRENLLVIDPFNEEPRVTYERICKNIERYNYKVSD